MPSARLVGLNHVALEVGDVDDALAFYGRVFEFTLRGRTPGMAFLDLGDQFIALAAGRTQPRDDHRHVGLVVDDKEAARRALAETSAENLPGGGLDFLDPWGNHVSVMYYRDVQFTKAAHVLRGMGLGGRVKGDRAHAELRVKGIAPVEQR